MINEQQERVEMLFAMMTAITGISRQKAEELLKTTVVYENILAGNECVLYESPSATLMEAVGELTDKGPVPAIEKITPQAVAALNQWMRSNQIYEAAELVEKLSGLEAPCKARTMDLLQCQLQGLSDELQEKINTWLLGAQNFTEHLFSQWSGRLEIPTPSMAGTRGMPARPTASVDLELSSIGSGIYRFVLTESAALRFSMERPGNGREPLCLVILCPEDERYSQVYPLSPLGGRRLRTRTLAELPAGEYLLSVPCGRPAAGGDDPANA